MEQGTKVTIQPSRELSDLRLDELIGREGVISCVKRSRKKVSGHWVIFSSLFMGEREWFIPIESIKE